MGQTFLAPSVGLYRIDVLLATYARTNTHEVIFHLRESFEATEDLYTECFDASDVEDNAYRTFEFPALSDSANHTFYFFLSAPQAEPGGAITVWKSEEDTLPDGQAFVSSTPVEGDLVFQTYYGTPWYKPSWFYQLVSLLDRLAANKPSLWGDRWFYVVLAAAYLALLYALLVRVMGFFVDEGS